MADLTITTTSGKLVDVKIEKVKPIGAKEPTIVERNENNELILKKRKTDTGIVFDAFKWITVDASGKEYVPKKINKFEITEDGKEIEVVFPPKTKRITFSMDSVIPITYLGRLLPESQYEVFAIDSASIPAIYEDIEKAINADVAYYVNPFTWKSDTKKQYYAVFIPYIDGGKFGFTLMTSEGKIELHHAMEMPSGLDTKKDVKVVKTIGNLASLLEVK